MAEQMQANWYVIHTYSAYEDKVMRDLQTMVKNRGLQDLIVDVKIPVETAIEDKLDKSGNKIGEKEVEHKIYPGYVFVKMVMNESTWYVVRNTRGCTGFVGSSPNTPEPLTEAEVIKWGLEGETEQKIAEVEVDFKVGDLVEIVSGSMEGSVGTVESIDKAARKVRVMITMFGRELPAELELHQVKLF